MQRQMFAEQLRTEAFQIPICVLLALCGLKMRAASISAQTRQRLPQRRGQLYLVARGVMTPGDVAVEVLMRAIRRIDGAHDDAPLQREMQTVGALRRSR